MMLSKIRSMISKYVGCNKKFKYSGSRNLVEEFNGVITEVYPNIFIIKMETGSIRSYSYNDLLIGALSIVD